MFRLKKYDLIQEATFTVVIPVYNEERSIRDCIMSLMNQTFRPQEIIVVDDGSIDSTVEICRTLGIQVLFQTHKGPGAARNLGANYAKGEVLILIDADMTFATDYIERLIAPILTGNAIATCHWNERVANWDNPWARCQTWYLGLPDGMRQGSEAPAHENIYRAVRKDFFLDAGGFDEDMGRGDDSSIAKKTGVFAQIIPDAICYHRNFSGLRETFREAVWHGRNVAVEKKNKTKRIIYLLLVQKNPILSILHGLCLTMAKREPRMLAYSICYTSGFVYGVLNGLYSGYYLK